MNDKLVGSPENMFIAHEYDITDILKKGAANTIDIIIRSPVLESRKFKPTVSCGFEEHTEYVNIRKAPSAFGWDIHPRLVTAGLWRDVSIDVRDDIRIEDMNFYTSAINTQNSTANFGIEFTLEAPQKMYDSIDAVFTVSKDGKTLFSHKQAVITYVSKIHSELKNVEFWWPCGYGAQPLYDVKVEVFDKNGKSLASRQIKAGFRTVRLEFADIEIPEGAKVKTSNAGTSYGKVDQKKLKGEFKFYINDVPIFMKGSNWVPLDAYHSRDKQFVKQCVEMLVDLNCNMIRCWGGNVYEDHEFFDLCDKYGILVWQDFALGCTVYPQDSDFAKKMEREVASVVRKLRSHTSIVLWAGNNEVDQCYAWRRVSPNALNPSNDRIIRQVIPNTVHEYDWTRPYLPSSPYLSERVFEQHYKFTAPEMHLWGPRGYYKAPCYTEALAAFVSELGYHGCPNKSSIEKMMDKKFVYPWDKDGSFNKQWQAKAVMPFQKSDGEINRNKLMTKQATLLYGQCPKDLDDFVFASQLVQAEAKKFFIELWRTRKFENKTGILWWNLRDAWPILSDSIVDYYGSKKLAYSFIKRVQTDVCAMMNDSFEIVVANDTSREVSGTVKVSDVDSGKTVFESEFSVPINGKACVGDISKPDGKGMFLIEYKVNGKTYYNHYIYGTPPFKLDDCKRWVGKIKL